MRCVILICVPPTYSHTHTQTQKLLPGDEVMGLVNRIYDFIFDCWVAPYPVVSNTSQPANVLPLPGKIQVEFLQHERCGILKVSGTS